MDCVKHAPYESKRILVTKQTTAFVHLHVEFFPGVFSTFFFAAFPVAWECLSRSFLKIPVLKMCFPRNYNLVSVTHDWLSLYCLILKSLMMLGSLAKLGRLTNWHTGQLAKCRPPYLVHDQSAFHNCASEGSPGKSTTCKYFKRWFKKLHHPVQFLSAELQMHFTLTVDAFWSEFFPGLPGLS